MNISAPAVRAWRGFLFGLLAFFCYSAGDVVVKKLSATYDVVQIFAVVQWVALPFMTAFVLWRGGMESMRSEKPQYQILRGILFLLQGLSAFYGFQHLPMAETYTFIFVMPIFTLLFAVLFLGEKVSRPQAMLILLAFTGVLVVFRPGLDALNVAALIVLAGSVIGGLSQVFMRHLAGCESFGASLIYPVVTGAVISALIAAQNWQAITPEAMQLFFLAGVIAAAAHSLILSAFYFAPASQVAPTQYSQIIWGVLYGYLFFGDRPDIFVMVGAVMIIFAGIWLARIEYRITHGAAVHE